MEGFKAKYDFGNVYFDRVVRYAQIVEHSDDLSEIYLEEQLANGLRQLLHFLWWRAVSTSQVCYSDPFMVMEGPNCNFDKRSICRKNPRCLLRGYESY